MSTTKKTATKTKLTITEAWAYLAKLWSKPKQSVEDPEAFVRIGDETAYGLCYCLNLLCDEHLITRDGYDAMIEQLYTHRPTNAGHHFWWPKDLAGAMERTKFCKQMAKISNKPQRKGASSAEAKA